MNRNLLDKKNYINNRPHCSVKYKLNINKELHQVLVVPIFELSPEPRVVVRVYSKSSLDKI